MSPTLVIHSGTYKTGSSSIQLFLTRAQHHGHLARAGVLYPQAGRTLRGVQHGNLVSELQGDRLFAPVNGGWDELVAEIRASELPLAVISSEHFSRLDDQQLGRVGEITRRAGIDVRWVHYLRDQPGFYNSFYVERLLVMRPENIDLVDRPFEQFGTWSPIDLSFLRYGGFAESVLRGIPGVDLVLRPFSRAHLAGQDALVDFIGSARLDPALVTDPDAEALRGETNVGTGWKTTETARRMLPIIRDAGLQQHLRRVDNRPAIRLRWTQLVRSEFVKATTDVGWNDTSAVYLTDDFRERLLADYHAENERVGAIGGFLYADIAAAAPVKPRNIGDYAEVSADELLTVLGRVLPLLHRPPPQIAEEIARHRRPRTAPTPPSGRLRAVAGAAARRLRGR